MPKNSSEQFYVARWTFPKAHKIFQSYLKIYSIYYEYSSKFKYNNKLNSMSKIFHRNVHYFWFAAKALPKISNKYQEHFGNIECNFFNWTYLKFEVLGFEQSPFQVSFENKHDDMMNRQGPHGLNQGCDNSPLLNKNLVPRFRT